MKIAYFDCFSGLSGNMIIGAFLDAGLPLELLRQELAHLHLEDEYQLVTKTVNKLGIRATYFDVELTSPHHHHMQGHHHHSQQRNLTQIRSIITKSGLSANVKDLALRIFTRLGQAEAKVHNCTLEEIHFHEVGAVDAIIDIVGAAVGYFYLGIDTVKASPLHVGSGTVQCAHGLMPIPAPATAELLQGIPIYSGEIKGELVTPTGAAIITTLCTQFGPLPHLTPEKLAYGAGTWDLAIPNVVRLYLGKENEGTYEQDTSLMIEATIDDMNPELYSYLMEKLLQASAADVFLTPIIMKKNRPGILLSVTSNLTIHQPLLDIIFSESTTLGIRMYPVSRQKLEKSFISVETSNGAVRVKIGKLGAVIKNLAPEYDDCRTLAEQSGIPLKVIYQEALSQAQAYLKGKENS